jgi:NAD(P)-dependent dehydrogenase (short-subunit alcohol dehydrogenase family)
MASDSSAGFGVGAGGDGSERKVALVTGASRGIGKAAALALAAAGFDVALTARTLKKGEGRDDSDVGDGAPLPGSLEETVAEAEQHGVRTLSLFGDVLEPDTLRAAVAKVLDEWGHIDVLVNNAIYTGPGGMVPLLDVTAEQLSTRLNGNVVAQLVITQAVLPGMLERGGGVIVNVTSNVATADPPAPVGQGGWGFGYAASKGAFHKMAGILAVELGSRGIIAFNVDPGYVDTEKQLRNAERNGLAGHYLGAPPSVPGAAIAWLATAPEARELTGQTIRAQKLALQHDLHEDWRTTGARG